MSKTDVWFPEFARRLIERSARNDWPDIATEDGREFWLDFQKALVRCGAHEDEADEASSVACDTPDLWPNQFRPLIVGEIRSIQARKQAEQKAGSTTAAPTTLDDASLASRSCLECKGSGLLWRYLHPEHADRFRTAGGQVLPVGATLVLVCECPMGEMIQRLHATGGHDKRHRMPTLASLPEFARDPVDWSEQPDSAYRYHPDQWNALDGCPMPVPDQGSAPAMVRRVTTSERGSSRPARTRQGALPHIRVPPVPDRLTEAVARSEAMPAQPAPTRAEPESPEIDLIEMTGWF